MIFVILVATIYGTGVDAASQITSDHSIDTAGDHDHTPHNSVLACEKKDEGDDCEYFPHALEHNFLFFYSHDQQLKKSIVQVLRERGFANEDRSSRLWIKSASGKALDLSFLDLPDVFDGKVTPNDFPVKVYLKEKWKGKCGAKGRKKWRACVGARETLVDACEGEGKDKGDWCTYSSLVLEKQRLEKAKIKLSFKGKCDSTAGDVHWCKFETLQEQQMEACLGKHVGKSCEYSTNGKGYSDLFKGLCTGGSGGRALWCRGVPAIEVDACEGHVRGHHCEVEGPEPWKGMCGYGHSHLQCLSGKESPSPPPEKPMPEPPVGGGGRCDALEKKVTSMDSLLKKLAAKFGIGQNRRRRNQRAKSRRRTKSE